MTAQHKWEYKTISVPTLNSQEVTQAEIRHVASAGRGQDLAKALAKWRVAIDAEINALGSQGWELISVWNSHFGSSGACELMTFKRHIS